jgi:hypothetical protein
MAVYGANRYFRASNINRCNHAFVPWLFHMMWCRNIRVKPFAIREPINIDGVRKNALGTKARAEVIESARLRHSCHRKSGEVTFRGECK